VTLQVAANAGAGGYSWTLSPVRPRSPPSPARIPWSVPTGGADPDPVAARLRRIPRRRHQPGPGHQDHRSGRGHRHVRLHRGGAAHRPRRLRGAAPRPAPDRGDGRTGRPDYRRRPHRPGDPAQPRSEVGRLGAALNGMLARIEADVHGREESQQQMRRFFGDASHELARRWRRCGPTPSFTKQGAPGQLRRGRRGDGPDRG